MNYTLYLYKEPFEIKRKRDSIFFVGCLYDEMGNRLCEFYNVEDAVSIASALEANIIKEGELV